MYINFNDVQLNVNTDTDLLLRKLPNVSELSRRHPNALQLQRSSTTLNRGRFNGWEKSEIVGQEATFDVIRNKITILYHFLPQKREIKENTSKWVAERGGGGENVPR